MVILSSLSGVELGLFFASSIIVFSKLSNDLTGESAKLGYSTLSLVKGEVCCLGPNPIL